MSAWSSLRSNTFLPRRRRTGWVLGLVLGGLSLGCTVVRAHDTWFQVAPSGRTTLWLGTGNRFPVLESRVEFAHLQRHGCARQADLPTQGAAAGRPLSPIGGPAGRLPFALSVRLPVAATEEGAPAPLTCWASLVPFEIDLEASKVGTYLEEIAAGPELQAAWAAEQAAGRPWRERFVKHARVEIGSGVSGVPLGLPFEAVLSSPAAPRVGVPLRFVLLQGGRPRVNHPVQLVGEQGSQGLWRRTDGQGQVDVVLPWAGRWLLRSTWLQPPARPGERWQSEFVTLAFDVAPAAP